MKNVKKILENDLINNIIPFWDNMIDEKYGGFYGATDKNHNVIKDACKGLVYTARILYSYSNLYNKYKDSKYLDAANHAYKFLINYMYDKEYGGFYWSVTNKGDVLDNTKHLYGQSFVLYGLANYYYASNNKEVLMYMKEIFELIKNNLIDFPNNYHEQYTRDFKVTENKIMEGYGLIPDITTNTLLHLTEALAMYYYSYMNYETKVIVLDLLSILFTKGYDETNKNLYQFLDRDLNNVVDAYSYGHNLEVSWLFMEIMRQCDINDRKYFVNCIEMFEKNFELSYRNGYIINQCVNGVVDYSAIWWIQAEALAAIKNINNIYPKEEYYEAARKITDFIRCNFMNEGKEWYWGINDDLSIQSEHSISEMWKANYHNVRAVLKILEESDGE